MTNPAAGAANCVAGADYETAIVPVPFDDFQARRMVPSSETARKSRSAK